MSAKDKITANSRTRIFAKVMVSFLLIILVPTVIMGIVWYQDIRKKNHGDMMEKERRNLAEVQEAYRRIVNSVEQDLVGVLYGTAYKNYMTTKKPEHMIRVMAEVSGITNWNPSLYSVYLYETETGKIWDSTSKQQSLEFFYDTAWLEQKNLSVSVQYLPVRKSMDEGFLEKMPTVGMAAQYSVKNVMTMITPRELKGVLVGNIDMEALGKELFEQFGRRDRRISLFREEQVLYDSFPQRESGGQNPGIWTGTHRKDFTWPGERNGIILRAP
ncbi:MAG: hypothetical protein HFH87_06745 [Lachnospiraceae bacterium]|nr:hypothetical protein [Lachnospiraceae bacterium]